MWVIVLHHLPDSAGALTGGLVIGIPVFVHGVEHTTMDGLEAITYIRESTRDDDRHRVVYVGSLHLILDVDVYNSVFSIQHSSLKVVFTCVGTDGVHYQGSKILLFGQICPFCPPFVPRSPSISTLFFAWGWQREKEGFRASLEKGARGGAKNDPR